MKLGKKGAGRVLLVATLLVLCVGVVSGQTTVDDFEDGDLNEYDYIHVGSNVGVTGSNPIEGSYSLNFDPDDNIIISNSGLSAYPNRGDRVEWYFREDGSTIFRVLVATSGTSFDPSDNYQFSANNRDSNNDKISITKDVDGTASTLASDDSISFEDSGLFRGVVEWYENGTIRYSVYNVDSYGDTGTKVSTISAVDNSHDSGGIGFGVYDKGNANGKFDALTFEPINDPPSCDSVSTTPSSWTLGSSIDISASCSDSDGTVSGVSADVYEDGTQIVSDSSLSDSDGDGTWEIDNLFTVDEADVDYKLELTATDDDGATSTYTRTETISDSSAGLKAAKPQNSSVYDDPVPYDVYLNDDGDDVEGETASCTLYADGNSFTSFSLTENGSHETGSLPNLGEGSHNFTASCTEDQGTSNLQDVFRDFTVDNTAPSLNITSPIGKLDIKQNIDFNYTVSDATNVTCKYNTDGGSNITTNSCNNASISFNEVGNHTVNLFATDAAGNTNSVSEEFTADYENTVTLKDKDSGSSIQNFTVTLQNQNGDSSGGSTSDGQFEFYTLAMPKGDVNMTLRADGYQTRNIDLGNVDKTFELNQEYEMTRAGIFIDAKDEQDQSDIEFSFVARNATASFNKSNIPEYDEDLRDVSGFPTGEVTITISDDDGVYRQRQYFATINENTRTMLTGYLLKDGEGIFTSVEVVDGQQNAVEGATVSIQKLYGTDYKTVVQKETTDSGGASFYLDPDLSYRAYVTHPNYVSFQGTFSPANYQFEPLIIQLGSSGEYNFTTRWDSISYKIEPDTNVLEGDGNQTFNWSVVDSKNNLTEFGARIWDNGTKVTEDFVKDSPSGGSVQITDNLSKYSSGHKLKFEGYLLTDGEYYSVNRTYIVRKGFDQGVFSINAVFFELKQSLDETGEAMISLIATFLVAIGTTKSGLGSETGSGFMAILTLGIFTYKGMFDGFIFLITLLLLVGIWASRRYD